MPLLGTVFGQQARPDPMQSLLGNFYDPAQARKQALFQGLTGAGMALLGNGKGSFGEVLGQGFAGGLQGAQQGIDTYRSNAREAYDMNQKQMDYNRQIANDTYNRNRQVKDDARQAQKFGWEQQQHEALTKWIGGLPPDQQAMAAADPQGAASTYLKQSIAPPAKPDLPTSVQEYNFAVGQGFKGSLLDYEAAKKGNGMTLYGADGQPILQMGGNGKPLTEGQSKDTGYAVRAEGALPTLDLYEKSLTDAVSAAGGSVPYVGNYLKSNDYQLAEQAGNEFLSALLRKDSGATITPDESSLYGSIFLPRVGDGKDVIDQKRAARQRAIAGINAGLPATAIAAKEKALRASGQAQPIPAPITGKEPISDPALEDALSKYGQ